MASVSLLSPNIDGSFPPGISIPSMYAKEGVFLRLAEEIKKVVSVPVIGVGRTKNLEYTDRIIIADR